MVGTSLLFYFSMVKRGELHFDLFSYLIRPTFRFLCARRLHPSFLF